MRTMLLSAMAALMMACTIAKQNSNNNERINPKEEPRATSDGSLNSLAIKKVTMVPSAQMTIELENSSKKPLRLWDDSNSWGAACWRVLVIREGKVKTFFRNPDQGFTKNNPTFVEIVAGGHIERKLDLNGGNWCGLGYCSKHYERGFGGNKVSFDPEDILIVIYDVPATQEARDDGVWYGVIAATASNEPLRAGSNTPNQPNIATNRNEGSARPMETSMNALNITKVEVSRAAQATLRLENSSKATLRIWKDSNSWGAACWRVLRIRNGSLEVFFQNPDQEFTRNGPTFTEIPAGGHLDQKLDLNGGNWCGLGHCSIHSERGFGGKTLSFEPNDTVMVIYDVPVTQEVHDHGVWYGVIAATATVR